MRLSIATLLGALGLVALLVCSGEAGWVIVDEAGHQTLLSNGRVKIAPRQAGGVAMAIDLGQGRLWLADPGRQVYWQGTVDDFCEGMRGAVAGALAGLQQQMNEQLKDMTPAQRQHMEQMLTRMGAGTGGPSGAASLVTIERTEERATIAGLPARKFRVLSGGTLYEEVWLTSDAALLRELDVGRAPDTFGRMSGCMAGLAGADRPEASPDFRKLYAEGWPLKAVFYGDGAAPVATTVVRVEPREVPDAEYAVPDGFRAAPLSEVFGTLRR